MLGHVISGSVVSVFLTVNAQEDVRPAGSVAIQLMLNVPSPKVNPEPMMLWKEPQLMETDPEASDAVSGTETRTLGLPPSGDTRISDVGQPENAGGVLSMYTRKDGQADVEDRLVAESNVRQLT